MCEIYLNNNNNNNKKKKKQETNKRVCHGQFYKNQMIVPLSRKLFEKSSFLQHERLLTITLVGSGKKQESLYKTPLFV